MKTNEIMIAHDITGKAFITDACETDSTDRLLSTLATCLEELTSVGDDFIDGADIGLHTLSFMYSGEDVELVLTKS